VTTCGETGSRFGRATETGGLGFERVDRPREERRRPVELPSTLVQLCDATQGVGVAGGVRGQPFGQREGTRGQCVGLGAPAPAFGHGGEVPEDRREVEALGRRPLVQRACVTVQRERSRQVASPLGQLAQVRERRGDERAAR
jgi:hypothetical protein